MMPHDNRNTEALADSIRNAGRNHYPTSPPPAPTPGTIAWHADKAADLIARGEYRAARAHLSVAIELERLGLVEIPPCDTRGCGRRRHDGPHMPIELVRPLVAGWTSEVAPTSPAHTGLTRDGATCQVCGVAAAHLTWRGITGWWHLDGRGEPTVAADSHSVAIDA